MPSLLFGLRRLGFLRGGLTSPLFRTFVGASALGLVSLQVAEAAPAPVPAEEPGSSQPDAPTHGDAELAPQDAPQDAPQAGKGDAVTLSGSRPTIFGRPLRREGFHFHASLGAGLGPEVVGLYHEMAIGWSFSGYSVSLLHTFLQNKGVFGTQWGGPDEIGGFMLQASGPIYFDDLTWKFASGVGGTIDQANDEFHPNPGFGIHYGVDLHYPIWPQFGLTLGLGAMDVFTQGQHYFGAGLALGVTVF